MSQHTYNIHTYNHMNIATYRLKRPMGQFSEKLLLSVAMLAIEGEGYCDKGSCLLVLMTHEHIAGLSCASALWTHLFSSLQTSTATVKVTTTTKWVHRCYFFIDFFSPSNITRRDRPVGCRSSLCYYSTNMLFRTVCQDRNLCIGRPAYLPGPAKLP